MNIVLENAKEFLDSDQINSFGHVFLRGNNGIILNLSIIYIIIA